MPLDSGEKLGPITLAYETYGRLNENRSNAILICTRFPATRTRRATTREGKPGWWDDCIGPGKAFDTDKYFVICSNVIGGCQGSTGPRRSTRRPASPTACSFRWLLLATWCARNAPDRLSGHGETAGRRRRLYGRDAGAPMGGNYPDRVRAPCPSRRRRAFRRSSSPSARWDARRSMPIPLEWRRLLRRPASRTPGWRWRA